MKRKEIISVIAITSLIILYIFVQPKEIIKNYPPKNNVVVAFGDSLIEGIGASSGNDLISIMEHSLDIEIINKGKSGDTTTSAFQRLNEILK